MPSKLMECSPFNERVIRDNPCYAAMALWSSIGKSKEEILQKARSSFQEENIEEAWRIVESALTQKQSLSADLKVKDLSDCPTGVIDLTPADLPFIRSLKSEAQSYMGNFQTNGKSATYNFHTLTAPPTHTALHLHMRINTDVKEVEQVRNIALDEVIGALECGLTVPQWLCKTGKSIAKFDKPDADKRVYFQRLEFQVYNPYARQKWKTLIEEVQQFTRGYRKGFLILRANKWLEALLPTHPRWTYVCGTWNKEEAGSSSLWENWFEDSDSKKFSEFITKNGRLLTKSIKGEEVLVENMPSVHYCTDTEKADYQISIDSTSTQFQDANGNFLDTTTQISSSSKEEFKGYHCLILDKDGKLFVHPHIAGKWHHTSVSRGEPVQFAGMGRFERGKLTGIILKSGHYHPTLHSFEKLLSKLSAQGIDCEALPVDFFKNNEKKEVIQAIVDKFHVHDKTFC